jgi:hypothetical protein
VLYSSHVTPCTVAHVSQVIVSQAPSDELNETALVSADEEDEENTNKEDKESSESDGQASNAW